MTPSGIRIRSATVAAAAAAVLATASWLATTAAYAAAPDPTVSAQPSPAPSPTTSFTTATGEPDLLLNPTSARAGDLVTVTFDRWDFKGCALAYDGQPTDPTTNPCTAVHGLLTGSVRVPGDATPGTELITACPTTCTGDNTIATGSLTIVAPVVTTPPTQVATVVVTVKPPPPPAQQTTTSTSGHTATLVAGGAGLVFIGSVIGLLMTRRRPPTIGQPPDIHLVPHPDPGVVTVDPANAPIRLHAHVTIRLRPDEGRCRVEAMQP